ncbi:transducin/WD40 repeat-like superfamily protein, partial [Striga asiatica]
HIGLHHRTADLLLLICNYAQRLSLSLTIITVTVDNEIPGFYYDPEKNRYFPCKGPIPGSSSKPPIPPPSDDRKADDGLCKRFKLRPELLKARELCGDVVSFGKRKLNFQAEYRKRHVSQPVVWKYRGTKRMANISLEHGVADVILPDGVVESDILLSGGMIGLLVFQVGKNRQEFGSTRIYKVDSVWPHNSDQMPRHKELLRHLGGYRGAGQPMSSDVSCVVASRNSSQQTDDTMSKHFVYPFRSNV